MYSVNIWHLIKSNKDILNIYECHKKKKFFPRESYEEMLEKSILERLLVNGILYATE